MNAKHPIFLLMLLAIVAGCQPKSPMGERVREPFQGSKYESNNRFFRSVGKGVSSRDNIARSKADLDAKTILAGQVETTIKNVSDQYLGQTESEQGRDVADKFQMLSRQVMNTTISDLRKIGDEKYYNGQEYTVFIAYEIKKNAMFRFMKKQARVDRTIQENTLKAIEEILDAQIAATED